MDIQTGRDTLEDELVKLALTESPEALVFVQKLSEVDGLLKAGASRYSVPGEMDVNDMYQEGLEIMLDFLRCNPGLDPNSDKWKWKFKNVLFHELIDRVRYVKKKKRDYRKKTPLIYEDTSDVNRIVKERVVTGNSLLMHPDTFLLLQEEPTPELVAIYNAQQKEVDEFVRELIPKLNDTQVVLLHELLYPSYIDTEQFAKLGYQRIHANSYASVAIRLGWIRAGAAQTKKVRFNTKRIREEAYGILQNYSFGRDYLNTQTDG